MTTSAGECDACRRVIGLWQAVLTSECAHTFHLRCVSGAAACPVCAAPWTDTPAAAPAPAPTTPYTFASTTTDTASRRTPLFGLPPSIAHKPSCLWSPSSPRSASWTPMFGQKTTSSPSTAACQPFNFSGVGRYVPEFGQQRHGRCAPAAPLCSVCHGAVCAVCHAAMRRGEATVTSECNHTFHLRCIASHGDCARSVCPVCRARWRDSVSLAAAPLRRAQPQPTMSFDDDEPQPLLLLNDQIQEASTTTNKDDDGEVVVLKTHCEHQAVARDTARDSFAVLVHAKAPAAAAATLDIVTVLDVSESMAGDKLAQLKQAMSFIIDGLGPRDRLSIVAFSCEARRILRFTPMSDGGKATAKAAVESLATKAGTDIGGGLRVATEVLDSRRHRNAAVTGIILLSDGKDNHNYHHPDCIGRIHRFSGLAPWSLRCSSGCLYPPPVHLFRLVGTDHDDDGGEAMDAIASVTRGSLSVIDDKAAAAVQDSMAQCIGELRSVAVQDARVVVECLHPGVHVRAVKKAGGGNYYPSLIDTAGRAASVDVGELYADEERRFLLFLGVPPVAAKDDGGGVSVTRLVKVSCTYKDAATRRSVDVCCKDDAAVLRPVVVVPATTTTDMDMEVARERFRVEAAEDIGAVQDAVKYGELARAARILDRRLEAMAVGLAVDDDDKCAELAAKLHELSARVAADRRNCPDAAPRVPAFGCQSSEQQPASTVQLLGTPAVPLGTPAGSMFGPTATATATGGFLFSYGPFVPSFGS